MPTQHSSQKTNAGYYDYRTLRHPNLDFNLDFCEMKESLILYLSEKQKPKHKQTLMPEKSTQWKEQLFDDLHELLGEVVFTSDPVQQLKVLERVVTWYRTKVNVKARSPSQKSRLKSPSPLETIDRSYSRLSTNATPYKEFDYLPNSVGSQGLELNIVETELPKIRPRTGKEIPLLGKASLKQVISAEAELKANRRYAKLRQRQFKEIRAQSTANGDR